MKQKLRAILSQWGDLALPVEQLTDHADLYAAGLSSLATVQLLMAIEEAFEIEMPLELLTGTLFQNIDTLYATVAAVCEQQTATEPGAQAPRPVSQC
jgi:acyl carrier protein